MANPHRNELQFDVAGRTFKAKLTLSAIAEVEDDTGMDFEFLHSVFSQERAPIKVIRSLLLRGLEGGGMTYPEALATTDQWLEETGLGDLVLPALEIYGSVWGAVDEATGKDEGEPEAETPSQAASPGATS